MTHVVVRYKVIVDRSGVHDEIPVILTPSGPLVPLIRYILGYRRVSSVSSMNKLVQAVGLLVDFVEANAGCFRTPEDLFEAFVDRLYSGTVGVDGLDPSDLYWAGRRPSLVRVLVMQVSAFSDWLADTYATEHLNPWMDATRAEERLAWIAWSHRRNRALLAHTMEKGKASCQMSKARRVLVEREPSHGRDAAKAFPDDRIVDLLFSGFIVPGRAKRPRIEERLNLRNVLITILMHFGGLRISEAFHIYAHDVIPDPMRPGSAYVRVFHPAHGLAPDDWLDKKGVPRRCTRRAYLAGKWGLRPRNELPSSSTLHAGWKDNAVETSDHFMSVAWFPTWAGDLFWKLWVFYMAQRCTLESLHPYAFVTREGRPYTIEAYEDAHRRAIERIGLVPGKTSGLSPHGHRHAYGRRLFAFNIDPILRRKALHHRSLESQVVYTEPDQKALAAALRAACERNGAGDNGPPLYLPDFLAYGFSDVDPLGLLSGRNPRLTRKW